MRELPSPLALNGQRKESGSCNSVSAMARGKCCPISGFWQMHRTTKHLPGEEEARETYLGMSLLPSCLLPVPHQLSPHGGQRTGLTHDFRGQPSGDAAQHDQGKNGHGEVNSEFVLSGKHEELSVLLVFKISKHYRIYFQKIRHFLPKYHQSPKI